MFRALGILVLFYVCYALARGEVFAKKGEPVYRSFVDKWVEPNPTPSVFSISQ
jgi:hypothetical protein